MAPARHVQRGPARERGPAALLLERGPADRQRASRHPPRPRPYVQGHLPPLQAHAGLPLPAQGRLGHPRPAGRARDREGAGDLRQGGDRASGGRGRVHPPLPRVGDALHRRLGADDRADGLLGEHGRRLLHPRQLVHRVGVVAAAADLGQGAHLPGLQGGALRPADRRHPLVARGGARVPGGRGPVDLRPLPGGGRGLPPRRRGTHLVPGVDHDSLDPALEPRPRRASRGRLRLRAYRFRSQSELAKRAAVSGELAKRAAVPGELAKRAAVPGKLAQQAAARRRLARRRAARRGLPRLSSGGELSRTRSHRHPVLRRDPGPRRGPRRCGAAGRRLHHREAGEGRRPGGDALHAPVRPPPGRRTHLPGVGGRLRDHRGRHRHRALRARLRRGRHPAVPGQGSAGGARSGARRVLPARGGAGGGQVLQGRRPDPHRRPRGARADVPLRAVFPQLSARMAHRRSPHLLREARVVHRDQPDP